MLKHSQRCFFFKFCCNQQEIAHINDDVIFVFWMGIPLPVWNVWYHYYLFRLYIINETPPVSLRIAPSFIIHGCFDPATGRTIWFNNLTYCSIKNKDHWLCIGSCSHDNLHLTTRPFPDDAAVCKHKEDSVPYPVTAKTERYSSNYSLLPLMRFKCVDSCCAHQTWTYLSF